MCNGGASVGRRLLAPAPAVRALQPVVFCSDYDPVSTTGNRESYFDAASGGARADPTRVMSSSSPLSTG